MHIYTYIVTRIHIYLSHTAYVCVMSPVFCQKSPVYLQKILSKEPCIFSKDFVKRALHIFKRFCQKNPVYCQKILSKEPCIFSKDFVKRALYIFQSISCVSLDRIHHLKYRALLKICRALLSKHRDVLKMYRGLVRKYVTCNTHTQYAIPPHFVADLLCVSSNDISRKIQGSSENV